MTTPTPNEVVLRLSELSRLLGAATTEIAQLDEDAVKARGAYEVAYARAFLTCEGAMDVRKQQAVLDVASVKLTAEIAEQKVRACRERIRTLRDQLEIGRSIGAAIRTELAATSGIQP